MEEREINIINFVTSVDVGGVSTLLLSYYRNMKLSGLNIDILTIDKGKIQYFENDFKKLGIGIYYMPKNYFKRLLFVFNFLRHRNYDIAHAHIEVASAIYLMISMICNIKIRIAHSHQAHIDYTHFPKNFLRFFLNLVSTYNLGCSEDALENLFPYKFSSKRILYSSFGFRFQAV